MEEQGCGAGRFLILALLFTFVASAGCGTGSAPTTRPSVAPTTNSPTTAPPTTLTIPAAQLKEVDLAAALLTLDDLPDGSRVHSENVDYLASGVPRIILCGEDVRREQDALTGRFSLFYGPEGGFLWASSAVSGLAGDNARILIDRLGEVAAACDQTWDGEGFEGAATEYEVLGTYGLPPLGDQTLAIGMAHRSAGYPDATMHLVYLRRQQFISAFLVIFDQGQDLSLVETLAIRSDEKLAAAIGE